MSEQALKQGETKTIGFKLDFEAFRLLNKDFEWVVEDGEFEIMIGAASSDIRLCQKIRLN